MEEETEYTKLPLEDRCVHKSWKARLHGYEECAKKFQCIDDEKSPEWNKFLGLMKKFVVDSNAAAQEKGLEATLAFIENAACAGKTVGEVMSGIVGKCIAAPKMKTKELAVQVTLMFIEIEKHESVQEELMKGTEAKNPKIVSACIAALTLSLKEFGPKVINIKPLMKKIPGFLEDRDKTVRDEGKTMVVEIYRWIGGPLRQQLNSLKAVTVSELEVEFAKLSEGSKACPVRYLRSQKPKVMCSMEGISGGGGAGGDGTNNDDNEDDEDSATVDIDPYELIDPVDILSKLPKDFFDKVEAKKWQERKEALEALEILTKNPKLESGEYGDVVRALKKIISKDSNVVVVVLAGKCLAGLANGLKKRFHTYAGACLPAILEKFREKKPSVVHALREAADAIFLSITIEMMLEDAVAALENKNPAVKFETAAFLARCFVQTPPSCLNKKLLKAYTGALVKTLNEPDPTVRDNSAEALGTAMKLVGEKAMLPFLTDLDALKMAKIKECADKAVIVHSKVTVSANARKAERPNTAPAKCLTEARSKESTAPVDTGGPRAMIKRPNTTTTKKAGVKKASTSSSSTNLNAGAGSKKSSSTAKEKQPERNLSNEEVDELASQILPDDVVSGLTDANWKTRLAAVEQLTETIKQMENAQVNSQVIVRTLGKKPGFKDTNFQVAKYRLEIVKMLAENYAFSATTTEYCIMDVTEKLGDAKNSGVASETLMAMADATSFELVANEVTAFAFNQKNPKVQQETLRWVASAIVEFGCTLNVKSLIESVKKALTATNPAVRTQAISLLGTLYPYVGKSLLMFFENEKPALRQQIEQECDKRGGETPVAPIRGPKSKTSLKTSASNDYNGVGENDEDVMRDSQPDINDLLPRVDISNHITESLLAELADKNWKVRNEALQKIHGIITEARLIKSSIGELARSLAPRLVDSNTKIAQTTLGICETLATAMGPPAKQHIRALFPGFVQCLGDSKNWIRTAAISCINTWGDECGYKEFFDGEMIGDALKGGSPTLRIELWGWLSQKLPLITPRQISKEELMTCIPHLYSNLEDRNSDVRKNAQEAVLGFMIHLTYEGMVRQTEKLKPGSKSVVLAALDKSRPNLPMKPLPSKKQSVLETPTQKVVKSGGAGGKASKTIVKPKSGTTNSKPGSARKKDDETVEGGCGPLLVTNNLKHQRLIDEQKLKIIKWNFTTPREEFVELLKELMSSAGVNKTLIGNMFHADFRYHLKAIEALTEDIQDNSKALVSNLDLILKWLTLRFFDTNPSVILKGLEYLQTVFNRLIEDEYHMMENEAASFIPYLITKIGDPKDTVRMGVRALFKQIALVYPVTKLFSYVMEGLKSKNARQRTECLDQLGSLIENYGITVCQPTPSAALREVAKQIGDRDNSVRNAALNCIVQAYFLEGERIIKLVGQISEKDLSLLEERIKRAAKNRPVKSASSARIAGPTAATVAATAAEDADGDYDDDNEDDEEEEEVMEDDEDGELRDEKKKKKNDLPEETQQDRTTWTHVPEKDSANVKDNKLNELPTIPGPLESQVTTDDKGNAHNTNHDDIKTHFLPSPRAKISGPFGLDMDFLKRIEETAPVRWKIPDLVEPSWDPNESIKALNSSLTSVTALTPPKLTISSTGLLSPIDTPTTMPIETTKEDQLERTILSIASLDLPIAIQSMNTIENLLLGGQLSMIQTMEDKFISSVTMQLKLLQTYPLSLESAQVIKGFRTLFVVTLAFYNTGILGKNVPLMHLQELVHQMITLLAENKLKPLDHPDAYTRVTNNIVVKVIEQSNHTTVICALINLLHGCAESNGPPKYEELVMKCLWKIVKAIPGWAGDLDYDTVLLEVHHFFKDYPTAWWKKRNSDTPLRTIKTLLHSMTKVKGSTILSHMTKINNIQESELHSYLDRLIATFRPGEISSGTRTITKLPGQSRAPKRLSKFTHEQLSEIFKKIGSKHQVQEGLAQLYDFKLQYPEADVQPFLLKSHKFFQDYIEQGLKDIDQMRKSQNINVQCNNQYTTESATETASITVEKSTMDPTQRLEKLRALEAQYRGSVSNQPNHT